MTAGFVKMSRDPSGEELIEANPFAWALATVIAKRARWSDAFNRHNLAPGEAFVGDFKKCGMTERQYRTAKDQLSKWHFATFKATNKGTIAKLTDTRLFDVLSLANDDQNADSRQAGDRQATTNEDSKTEKTGKIAISKVARDFKIDPTENREDWHSLSVLQKAQRLLEPSEFLLPDERWQKRAAGQPERLARVLDKMNADIKEGTVIKKRGAYAEQLWKITAVPTTEAAA